MGMGSATSGSAIASVPAARGGRTRLAPAIRVVSLVVIGVGWLWIAVAIGVNLSNPAFGLDYRWHVAAAHRLLDTGTPYLPFELSGPFVIGNGAILYPPTALLLFIPFIWLPTVLWWAIPVAITAYAMWWHRPPLWAWAIITVLLAYDRSINVYVVGNPSMWIVAAIAAGTVWRWPFVLVFAKPTFAPVAFLGIRHRSWWIALGILALASLPFLPVWFDWIKVVTNSDVSVLYNVLTVPLILVPLVAWATGRDRPAWIDWTLGSIRP
jgi:hypothetical protein